MKISASYFPADNEDNSYVSNMIKVISIFCDVYNLTFKQLFKELISLNFKRRDIVFLNWFENSLVNDDGKITVYNIFLSCLKFMILKIKYKRIIYVKHNVYPHKVVRKFIGVSKFFLNLFCMLSDEIVVHSPVDEGKEYTYIPHPLYNELSSAVSHSFVDKDLFVIFGRIERYKKIEKVISSFPPNKKLLILGSCKDELYLSELVLMAKQLSHVTIRPGYLSDVEATKILKSCCRLLITHSDDDMIVSGSFFYAISNAVPVYAINTPFLLWASDQMNEGCLHCFNNLDSMMFSIKSDTAPYNFKDSDLNIIEDNFGINKIQSEISILVNNIENKTSRNRSSF